MSDCAPPMNRVFPLYALSGLVSLGYQVAWFRIYVDRFGSTNVTFALVLCNFIAGLGFGALASRWLTARLGGWTGITDKLRLYGLVELLVAATVVLTFAAGLLPADLWGSFPYVDNGLVYEQTLGVLLGKLGLATLCVFVPCFFMGVTFPLLCDAFGHDGRFPAQLYAWNTMGACAGVVLAEFVFLLTLGHEGMLALLVLVNVGLGLAFLLQKERSGTPLAEDESPSPDPAPEATGAARPVGVLLLCAVLSGFLAGALEGDLFKRIAFVGPRYSAAMSFVSFWAIVGIFLASWTVRFWRGLRLVHIQIAFALGLAYDLFTWWQAYPIYESVYSPGLGPLLWFVGIFVLPPFFCISLLLPYVCNRIQAGRRHLGLAYGLNTLAFCAGMVGFTYVAPGVNAFYAFKLAVVVFAVVVLLLFLLREDRPLAAWKPLGALALLAAGCVLTPRDFDARMVNPVLPSRTSPIRAMKSNAAHTTYVVEAPRGDMLYFDNHPMSGTSGRAQVYMRLMAHFPLLCQERPETALLICFGVGNTASAIAGHDTIRRLDVVDLNDKVIETAPEFARSNRRVYEDPRVRFLHDDGRSFLRTTDERYDLITSEPPPPMHSGVYRLYSREYYEDVAAHLTPRGLMTQWLPIFQMPQEAVDLAVATFLDVFPDALMFTGFMEEILLVGGLEPIDLTVLERRFDTVPGALRDLRRFGMRRPVSLLARILQGDAMLREEYGGGRVISDQRNDFALLFYQRAEHPTLRYDPERMLRDVRAERLDGYEELRREVLHLGRLTYHVPDFPTRSLASTRALGDRAPALAQLDWEAITQLRTDAAQSGARGDLQATTRLYEALERMAPELPGVQLEHARLLKRRGENEAALALLQRFLEAEPDDFGAYLDLFELQQALDRPRSAAAAIRRALELEPDNAEAQRMAGSF